NRLLVIRPAKYGRLFENLSVSIHGCIISNSSTIKNLGMIFDSRLTFQSHIKSITACFHLLTLLRSDLFYHDVMLKLSSMHLYPPDLITVMSFSLLFQILGLEVFSLSRTLQLES
ncbi:hypothetical protein LDENG_00075790, partial [Lucifuga dentata]